MVYVRSSLLLALCAALAACSDGGSRRELVAPEARPSFDLSRPKGDRVFALADGGARLDIGRAAVPKLRMPLGARSLGEASIMYLDSRQTYFFAAFATGDTPAAKGVIHATITSATTNMEIDAAVDCLLTVGNQAWVSGPVRRFVFNGKELTATFDLLIRVQDSGEGRHAGPDLVSAPFGAGPQACMLARDLPMLPNEVGAIQVVAR